MEEQIKRSSALSEHFAPLFAPHHVNVSLKAIEQTDSTENEDNQEATTSSKTNNQSRRNDQGVRPDTLKIVHAGQFFKHPSYDTLRIAVLKNDRIMRLDQESFYEQFKVHYLLHLIYAESGLINIFYDDTNPFSVSDQHEKALESVYLKFISKEVGWGVFAAKQLPVNWCLGEYLGVVQMQDGGNVYTMEYPYSKHRQMSIDATYFGNITRFVNHSDTPNVEVTWSKDDKQVPHLKFVTNTPIGKDQQLLIDYGPNYWVSKSPLKL